MEILENRKVDDFWRHIEDISALKRYYRNTEGFFCKYKW